MSGAAKRTLVQQALIDAVKAECRRVRRDTAAAAQDLCADSDQHTAIVLQNTLRTCIEAAIDESMPFGRGLPAELAVRLASYAISILPAEEQDLAIAGVINALPSAHRARMRQGIRIATEWGTVQ